MVSETRPDTGCDVMKARKRVGLKGIQKVDRMVEKLGE